MLRVSGRKRVSPKGRGDNVATSAKRTVLRSIIDGNSGINRSIDIEGPVATTLHSSKVMPMTTAPVITTATSSSTDTQSGNFPVLQTPSPCCKANDDLARNVTEFSTKNNCKRIC